MCKGPTVRLTYEQHKVASKVARERCQTENANVNEVLDLIDREALHLSMLHKKSVAYFLQQLPQCGKFAWKKRGLNIFNAAQHAIGHIVKEKECEYRQCLLHVMSLA